MKLKRAARRSAAISVMAGALVLGLAGVAGACHVEVATTVHVTTSVAPGSAFDTATITPVDGGNAVPNGTVSYKFFTNGTCNGNGASAGTGTQSSTESGLAAGSYSFQAHYTAGEENIYPSASGQCEPFTITAPPPHAPTAITVAPVASQYCGDLNVTLTVTAGPGTNGYSGTGTVTATSGSITDTSFVPLSPGGHVYGGITFPGSDAGKTETVTVTVVWSNPGGGTVTQSANVTLPNVCTTTVTTPPVTVTVPGPTTTVTVPGPTQVVTVPCYGALPGGGAYGGACPVPGTPPAPPVPSVVNPGTPTKAVPVGAPQTGFGGAASSGSNWLLPTGGGLVLIGLLTALILFTTRKRDA